MEHTCYNIVDLLKKGKHHIREIADLLGTNHMRVKRELLVLQDKNVVDFNKEGRNYVYFLKDSLEAKQYILISEHYKLLEASDKKELRKLICDILSIEDISLAIIFGSYAKGEETEESDIDLYVESDNRDLKKEIERNNTKASVKIGRFNPNSELGREIIKNHVIIRGVERFYELVPEKAG